MGDVIQLSSARRAAPADGGLGRLPEATLFFDLASPFTYLVAERFDRRVAYATWQPTWGPRYAAAGAAAQAAAEAKDPEAFPRARQAAEQRAAELHLPLIWPERYPARVPCAMRVADYANERGRGAAFTVAAGRLAFCGGFDLEDPRILAEAAAAAGLDAERALHASRDRARDDAIAASARMLWAEGASMLPALRIEGRLLFGEPQITGMLVARAGHRVVRPSAS